MNYGFSGEDFVHLHEDDEINRYGIQLYHHTVKQTDLSHKKILEVGCGRGGGAYYVARYFNPEVIIGIDRSKEKILFNNSFYQSPNLSFQVGNAHEIPFADASFDVVINVESSHHYVHFDRFLSEVKRVLKPGGKFLFTDFRLKHLVESMLFALEQSGMTILSQENISQNIVNALDLDYERRVMLIKKMLPSYLNFWALHFSGAKDTAIYKSFKNGDRIYYHFVLKNPIAEASE